MTTDGIQDIYVLTIDLTESTLELKEVESKTEYGLKETVPENAHRQRRHCRCKQ